jgi:hypothetical protein
LDKRFDCPLGRALIPLEHGAGARARLSPALIIR